MSNILVLKKGLSYIFHKLTHYKLVKSTIIFGVIFFWSLFPLSYIVSIVFGTEYYSPLINFISDLGRTLYTPAPILFDLACVITGMLIIPFVFYIFKKLYFNAKIELTKYKSLLYKILVILAFSSGLSGSIGLSGIGIFSLERSIFNLHYIFAISVVLGLIFFAFFIGLLIITYKIPVSKIIGIGGFICSIIIFIAYLLVIFIFPHFQSLLEWFSVISITIWLCLFALSEITKKKVHIT
jgi:hypothetical protein